MGAQRGLREAPNAPDTALTYEFGQHQAGLDRFAEADVVGDQQVDPRHRQSANHRVELVFVDLDAAAKGGLEGLVVGLGDSAPAHGIKERLKAFRHVEAIRARQGGFFVNRGAGFHLPDDLKLLAKAIVLDRGKPDEMAWPARISAQTG